MRAPKVTRRIFLRGTGSIAVALPLLELTHGKAWSACGSAGSPQRFVLFFPAGGGNLHKRQKHAFALRDTQPWDDHTPTGTETNFALSPTHDVLEPYKSKLCIPTGINNYACIMHDGGHEATENALTCYLGGEGPSIDQVLAQRLAERQPATFPSVDLKIDGYTGANYGEPCFTAPGQAVSRERDPMFAFDRLFAGVTQDSTTPDPELERIRSRRASILDGIREGFNLLVPRLGVSDKRIVEAHLEQIRELERRLQGNSTVISAGCQPPTVTELTGDDARMDPANQKIVGEAMMDLAAQAIICGLTNVATIWLRDSVFTGVAPTPFSDLVGSEDYQDGHSVHHAVALIGPGKEHEARKDELREQLQWKQRFQFTLFKRLLDQLDATPEGDCTVLDNSLCMVTSDFQVQHEGLDHPFCFVGSAGGRVRNGVWLKCNTGGDGTTEETILNYETRWSTNNLYTSILHAFGYSDEHFGPDYDCPHEHGGTVYACPERGPLPGFLA